MSSQSPQFERGAPERRFVLVLLVLALLTRMLWVLWLHPPQDYVFSDMGLYVARAQQLALGDGALVFGDRGLAWQAYGTHSLLALPLWLVGAERGLRWAAVLWGLMSALSVPLGYALGCRILRRRWQTRAVGIALLCWHPNLSNSGYFLSETPFLFFQLWATYGLVALVQDGRGRWGAGVACALAFAIRPQSAVFFVLALATWLLSFRRLAHVRLASVAKIALPLLLMLGFSMWRFHAHTGRWGGIAENANMNLTAGRCHNIVTQAFKTEAAKRSSERRNSTRDGRRVSLPNYRALARAFPPEHPLALRPALGSETIRMVGYIGDPEIHRQIRKECYAHTGLLEQARYSVVNAMLMWFVAPQWPESDRGHARFYRLVQAYNRIFQVVLWLPSLLGTVASLVCLRRRPDRALLGWQLFGAILVASVFFGDIRLRTPYDPYAIILAIWVYGFSGAALLRAWRKWRARRNDRLEVAAAAGGGH